MIKAKLNNGNLIFGITRENVDRLKSGQSILINLKDMGLEDRKIVIHYRETEEELFAEMSEHIELGKTKIHLP